MNELDFDITQAVNWFVEQHTDPFTLIEVDETESVTWRDRLGVAFRRCYICDHLMDQRVAQTGTDRTTIVNAVLPDPSATMAGDFGEILVYFYHASKAFPLTAFGPKKWRLKQDRTKPAPYSDTVQFVLPSWPTPSENDVVMCAEVKTKSTAGASNPIKSAIEDCKKDRTSRLAKTLVWLKERALVHGLGDTEIAHLDRFIHSTNQPSYKKEFRAVAVICSSLVADELPNAPTVKPQDYDLIIISIPQLHSLYNSIYVSARNSVNDN